MFSGHNTALQETKQYKSLLNDKTDLIIIICFKGIKVAAVLLPPMFILSGNSNELNVQVNFWSLQKCRYIFPMSLRSKKKKEKKKCFLEKNHCLL